MARLILVAILPVALLAKTCKVANGWCSHEGADFEIRDCDADGIPDPTCKDGQGRFGVIQSSKNCADSWPNGKCVAPMNREEVEQIKFMRLVITEPAAAYKDSSFAQQTEVFHRKRREQGLKESSIDVEIDLLRSNGHLKDAVHYFQPIMQRIEREKKLTREKALDHAHKIREEKNRGKHTKKEGKDLEKGFKKEWEARGLKRSHFQPSKLVSDCAHSIAESNKLIKKKITAISDRVQTMGAGAILDFFGKQDGDTGPCNVGCEMVDSYKDYWTRNVCFVHIVQKHSDRRCTYPQDWRLAPRENRHVAIETHNGCAADFRILTQLGTVIDRMNIKSDRDYMVPMNSDPWKKENVLSLMSQRKWDILWRDLLPVHVAVKERRVGQAFDDMVLDGDGMHHLVFDMFLHRYLTSQMLQQKFLQMPDEQIETFVKEWRVDAMNLVMNALSKNPLYQKEWYCKWYIGHLNQIREAETQVLGLANTVRNDDTGKEHDELHIAIDTLRKKEKEFNDFLFGMHDTLMNEHLTPTTHTAFRNPRNGEALQWLRRTLMPISLASEKESLMGEEEEWRTIKWEGDDNKKDEKDEMRGGWNGGEQGEEEEKEVEEGDVSDDIKFKSPENDDNEIYENINGGSEWCSSDICAKSNNIPWYDIKAELEAARSWLCHDADNEGLHNFYYQLLLRLKGYIGECNNCLENEGAKPIWNYPDFPIENGVVVKRVYEASRYCTGCTSNSNSNPLPELHKVRDCLKLLLEVEDKRIHKPWTLSSIVEKWQNHWLLKLLLSVGSAIGLWPAIEQMLRKRFSKKNDAVKDENKVNDERRPSVQDKAGKYDDPDQKICS